MYKKGWESNNDSLQALYKEVRKHALSLYHDVTIPQNCYVSNRMGSRSAGRYFYTYHRTMDGQTIITDDAIVFSSLMTQVPRESQIETVIHEIAHCVADKYFGFNCGHDANWKSVGDKIGKAFRQEVTVHVVEPDLIKLMRDKRKRQRETPYKYNLVCTKCGAVIGKYKTLPKTHWLHNEDMGICIYEKINF